MNVLKLSSFKTTLSVVICLSLSLLTGCENCEIITCRPFTTYSINLVGFNIAELNTIEVRSFKKGSNFTEPVNEWIITPDNAEYSLRINTTDTYIVDPRKSNFEVSAAYDYEVFVPSTESRWSLTEITDIPLQQEYCRFSLAKNYCYNREVTSYNLNGTTFSGLWGIPSFVRENYYSGL
jgi:hypothetical protein